MPEERPAFWRFKRPRQLLGTAFGCLERRVMDLVWKRGTLTVRAALLDLGRQVAYTTLMTTFDRLFKKGLLERRKQGRAYLYSAVVTSDEIERSVARDVVSGLLAGSGEARPLLSSLVDAVSESDHRLLDELDRLVREKRRTLRLREGR
jgi:predicted transcriptional regulator